MLRLGHNKFIPSSEPTTEVQIKADFASWRKMARQLLADERHPDSVEWIEVGSTQRGLRFQDDDRLTSPAKDKVSESDTATSTRVPREFIQDAQLAAVHREPRRWQVLYRILWRLTHGESHLLDIEVDDDVSLLRRMAKQVGRDIHKMHAFVRFRLMSGEILASNGSFLDQPHTPDKQEIYIAWHSPDHNIIKLAAPFFARRFHSMTWAILTPDGSAYWDKINLSFGPGCPEGMAPRIADDLESLWCSYYSAVFNPARVKIKAMKREMPVRHWRTLPETAMIPQLLADSPARVEKMLACQPSSAAPYLPPRGASLDELRAKLPQCRGCSLHERGCEPVFGAEALSYDFGATEGRPRVKVVVVGEQPELANAQSGAHDSGPADTLMKELLLKAGVDLSSVYLTYAVKHSKTRQMNDARNTAPSEGRAPDLALARPSLREVAACRPWLGAELEQLKPTIIVCLGSAAALAVLGRKVRLQEERGQWQASRWAKQTLVTENPLALLQITSISERMAAVEKVATELAMLNSVLSQT